MPLQNPVEWLCIDIETEAGRPEAAEEWARRYWQPNEAWKPETIGRRYLEALEKKREKLALLDSAGIAVIALRDSSGQRPVSLLHNHGVCELEVEHRAWGLVGGYADEKAMLIALREYLNNFTDRETLVVGHNVRGFDLPRLRFAYLRAGLQLPGLLASPDVRVFDTMREYARRFSVEREEFVSLETVLTALGMPNHKELMDGSQVGELLASGSKESLEVVLQYASQDVLCESEVFLRLAGRSVQLV